MMWVARSKLLSPLVKSENEHNAGIVKGGWSGVVSYITWRSGGVSHLFTFCGRTTPLSGVTIHFTVVKLGPVLSDPKLSLGCPSCEQL